MIDTCHPNDVQSISRRAPARAIGLRARRFIGRGFGLDGGLAETGLYSRERVISEAEDLLDR